MFMIVGLSLLAICIILIVTTLVSLPKLGDERANYIKMRAQSYAFTVVVGFLLLDYHSDFCIFEWLCNAGFVLKHWQLS